MFQELIDLWKAKSHKYTHKKRVYIKGKPSWRYYYKEHHGGGVTNVKDLKEGDAFKVNYKGQEGHFHIKKTEGNKVTVVLDETGKETTLSKSELRQVLLKTHATALKENVEKKKQTLAKRKSAKAKERAQQALDRAKSKIDGLEDEPPKKKQEEQKNPNAVSHKVIIKDRRGKIHEVVGQRLIERFKEGGRWYMSLNIELPPEKDHPIPSYRDSPRYLDVLQGNTEPSKKKNDHNWIKKQKPLYIEENKDGSFDIVTKNKIERLEDDPSKKKKEQRNDISKEDKIESFLESIAEKYKTNKQSFIDDFTNSIVKVNKKGEVYAIRRNKLTLENAGSGDTLRYYKRSKHLWNPHDYNRRMGKLTNKIRDALGIEPELTYQFPEKVLGHYVKQKKTASELLDIIVKEEIRRSEQMMTLKGEL